MRGMSKLVVLAALAIVLATTSLASACPSCQAALADDASAINYMRGVQYSILFMLSMPFAIVGAWAGAIFHMVRKEKQRLADLGLPSPYEQYTRKYDEPKSLPSSDELD